MNEVLTSVGTLSRRLGQLEQTRRNRSLSAAELSAFAECKFRIAVDPSTATATALDLLLQAVRLDRTNPKYHYHMARLWFAAGELDAAARWLAQARELCPTSHRIWTHIGLLQREINDRYRNDTTYIPDEHMRRWREIAERVLSGADRIDTGLSDFRPKPLRLQVTPEAESDEREANPGVRRVLAPGVCRWLPINDLIADDLLQSEPGERKRNSLRKHLETASARAGEHGGAAAFVVLAAEWLLRGYSPDFIARIRPASVPHTTPGGQLLDALLDILAAPPAAVAQRLAVALEKQLVPPLVGAALHRLHVLGPTPSLTHLASELRAARAWLAGPHGDGDEEQAREIIRALEQEAKALDPRPRAAVADFPAEQRSERADSPEETVRMLEAHRARADARVQSAREWLAAKHDDPVEANRIRQFLRKLKDESATAVQRLSALRAEGRVTSGNLAKSIARLEEEWQSFTMKAGPLLRLLQRYPEVDVSDDEPEAASPVEQIMGWEQEMTALAQEIAAARAQLAEAVRAQGDAAELIEEGRRVRAFLQRVATRSKEIFEAAKSLRDSAQLETSAAEALERAEKSVQNLNPLIGPIRKILAKVPDAPVPAAEATPAADVVVASVPATSRERLQSLAGDLEGRLRAVFERASATFEPYSPPQRTAAPLRAVRLSVRARKAETLYRLGQRNEARGEWNAMLTEDRLALDVLRNLAVCDSRTGNMQRCLDSWRSYAEMLYFHAIAAADPTRLAAERIDLHQNFGNAYAPRAFYTERSGRDQTVDGQAVAAFFSSPARVRLFMRHRIMALLNARLDVRTAPFILGVTRTAGAEARDAACKKMNAWVGQLSASLPRRVSASFAAMISARLANASEQMTSLRAMRDLGSRPEYENEKTRYLAWLKEIVQWKFELRGLLQHFPDPAGHPELLQSLIEICAADEIPLDTSEELLQTTAQIYGQNPAVLTSMVSGLAVNQVAKVLRFVFPSYKDADDLETRPARLRMYERLTEELAGRAATSDPIPAMIDCPEGTDFDIYPPTVRANLKSNSPTEETVSYLGALHERYPRSSGIAYDYALTFALTRRFTEARRVLERAIPRAFHERGRELCQNLLKELPS